MSDKSIFLKNIEGADWYYSKLRDSKEEAEEREYVEQSWALYKPFCPDSNFRNKLAEDMYPTLWHLHLARLFLDHDFEVLPTEDAEPDLCLVIGGKRVWVEAVCAKPGNGPDAVRVAPRGVGAVPEREIVLRLTNALHEKASQHRDFFVHGRGKGDSYAIALSSGLVPLSDLHDGVTNIEKVLFGIGDFYWQVSTESGEVTKTGYLERSSVTKRSGAEVSTSFFGDRSNSHVSAVLFSHHHFRNNWNLQGKDLILIHNPLADTPMSKKLLPFGKAVAIQDGTLKRQGFDS